MPRTAYVWIKIYVLFEYKKNNNKLKLNGDRNTTIACTYNIMWYDAIS